MRFSKKSSDRSTSALLRHKRTHDRAEEGAPQKKQKKLEFTPSSVGFEFEDRCLRFFAAFGVPFRAVESDEFREMIRTSNSSVIPSRRKLAGAILARNAAEVRTRLLSSTKDELLSLSLDEFSHRSRRFLTITASNITTRWTMNSTRLDIVSLDDQRATGEVICDLVIAQLKKFNISLDKIVSITRDGGSNVVKAAKLLGIESIHCYDHYLHLCLSDAFKSRDVRRVIKRIQKVSAAFKNSPMASNLLLQFSKGKTLKLAVVIRWNSTLAMLRSYSDVYEGLVAFTGDAQGRKMPAATAILDADGKVDIKALKALITVLSFFESMTLMAEARTAFASVIPYLLYRIEEFLRKPLSASQDNALATAFLDEFRNSYTKRLRDYRNHDLLLKVTFFDARFVHRMEIFDKLTWARAEQLVKEEIVEVMGEEHNATPEEPCENLEVDLEDIWKPLGSSSASASDSIAEELEIYRRDNRLPAPTPSLDNSNEVLKYWKSNTAKLPRLSALARRYLSTVASSAEPERVFSGLNYLLVNPRRDRMTNETVENLTTVRHGLACQKVANYERTPACKDPEVYTVKTRDEDLDDLDDLDDDDGLSDDIDLMEDEEEEELLV